MWCASADSPHPARHTGPGSRVSRNSAAPSPMLMPARCCENGLQRAADTDSSALKPATVKRHSESAPPAITASTMPARSMRAADISALALDEHAVDRVHAGPCAPLRWRTNCAAVPISCWA
ncbi:Uncharacterised protein [Stenotrophomonas maltophilia]|nr:Uncharacterised protein [Stenotrophomonas maltophilia]